MSISVVNSRYKYIRVWSSAELTFLHLLGWIPYQKVELELSERRPSSTFVIGPALRQSRCRKAREKLHRCVNFSEDRDNLQPRKGFAESLRRFPREWTYAWSAVASFSSVTLRRLISRMLTLQQCSTLSTLACYLILQQGFPIALQLEPLSGYLSGVS